MTNDVINVLSIGYFHCSFLPWS